MQPEAIVLNIVPFLNHKNNKEQVEIPANFFTGVFFKNFPDTKYFPLKIICHEGAKDPVGGHFISLTKSYLNITQAGVQKYDDNSKPCSVSNDNMTFETVCTTKKNLSNWVVVMLIRQDQLSRFYGNVEIPPKLALGAFVKKGWAPITIPQNDWFASLKSISIEKGNRKADELYDYVTLITEVTQRKGMLEFMAMVAGEITKLLPPNSEVYPVLRDSAQSSRGGKTSLSMNYTSRLSLLTLCIFRSPTDPQLSPRYEER